MRKRYRLPAVVFGSLTAASSVGYSLPKPVHPRPRLFPIVVHHDECTECGDFEIESGEVVVPVTMRERYVQALANSPRFGSQPGKRSRVLAFCNGTGYRVGNVKLKNDKEFGQLFLLPGRTRDDTIQNSAGVVYPWDFKRRHRVTVEVVGIKWSYLTVRVHNAIRLTDQTDC